MTYRVQILCDVRSRTGIAGYPDGPWCHTDGVCSAQNPAAMGRTADLAVREAKKEAERLGWKRGMIATTPHSGHSGWMCPHCQKYPPEVKR